MEMVFEWWHFPALFAIGLVVSFVNAIAGGGSVLSLPLLILLGLPAATANGTNRIGILAGSLSATYSLARGGMVSSLSLRHLLLPVGLGAILGAWVAVEIPERPFKAILAAVVVAVVIATFTGMGSPREKGGPAQELDAGMPARLAYFGLGLYGGFLQVGIGFIMIFLFSRLSSMNLLQVNGLKAACTVLFSALSTLVFAGFDKIHWPMAAALAMGNLLGGYGGARWQIRSGEIWVKRFLLFIGLAVAAKLLWDVWG